MVQYGRKYGRYITTPLDPSKCGTEKGYKAHLRRGQVPCDPCLAGNAEAVKQRRLRRSGPAKRPKGFQQSLSPEGAAKAQQWRDEGRKVGWIAEQLGCSVATVYRRTKKAPPL